MTPPERDFTLDAARLVDAQASAEPVLGIPADPDVADRMGAFIEDAITLDDLEEDAALQEAMETRSSEGDPITGLVPTRKGGRHG